ncbi:MAG: C-terminal helicase domain-containing protein [Lyngbya sp.]|nr:C-terminal helicase domain-containing protein [Lyngbya sp.]
MNILHGTWIPRPGKEFIQTGAFFVWVETDSPVKKRKKQSENRHPRQLNQQELSRFLGDELKLPAPKYGTLNPNLTPKSFLLPNYFKQSLRYNTYYLHGGTARQKRERMIAEFQYPETEPSAFILSLKAGGVGITLTKANHVFNFDRWWNPAVEDQATDRAFRIGQKKNVFVHKFVALGTLEERIDQMIEDKKKIANAIVGADESWLTELDNESFKQLIALNKQAVM